MIQVVHESLAKRELLPSEHLVDKGYTDSEMLVESERQHGVRIIGPVSDDPSWQLRAGGLDKSQFTVDWERKVVTCPAGKQLGFLREIDLTHVRYPGEAHLVISSQSS